MIFTKLTVAQKELCKLMREGAFRLVTLGISFKADTSITFKIASDEYPKVISYRGKTFLFVHEGWNNKPEVKHGLYIETDGDISGPHFEIPKDQLFVPGTP